MLDVTELVGEDHFAVIIPVGIAHHNISAPAEGGYAGIGGENKGVCVIVPFVTVVYDAAKLEYRIIAAAMPEMYVHMRIER